MKGLSDFGLAIRRVRDFLGIDQTEMARDVGVTRPYLSAMERGHKSVTFAFVELICDLYDLCDSFRCELQNCVKRRNSDYFRIKITDYTQEERVILSSLFSAVKRKEIDFRALEELLSRKPIEGEVIEVCQE